MQQVSAQQVLYIEDDRINIVLMEEVFRRLPGWDLVCAETGTEALMLLQAGLAPALLLIDMNLPDTHGMTLFARLRSDLQMTGRPCVALSADDDSAQVAAALAAGFCDYWVKPIDVTRFVAALQARLSMTTA